MPLILSGNVASATAAAYDVANSCRFNSGDSPGLVQTPSAGNADRWTLSIWFKRSDQAASHRLLTCVNGSNYTEMGINASDILFWNEEQSGVKGSLVASRTVRDVSAWMHLVFTWDSANGVAGNRMRLYINGTEETSFSTDTNPSSGQDSVMGTAYPVAIGSFNNQSNYQGCYFAEVAYCNGQAYAASDFGEFDSDSPTIWKPKDISGLTYGTGGFYLDFEDSSDLGKDVSGQGNDFTVSNLAAADQATDTPTNNFCTLNPLSMYHSNTPALSQGNCRFVGTASDTFGVSGTMGVSSGKWYFEMKKVSQDAGPDDDSDRNVFGITAKPYRDQSTYSDAESWMLLGNSVISNNGVEIASVGPSSLSDGGILQVALDLDNNRVAFGHEDAWQTGSSAFSGSYSDYESITAAASTISGFYFPIIGDNSGSRAYTMDTNFGGCPAMTISSAAADANGYGAFEFAPPSGFLAMCTKNLGSEGG